MTDIELITKALCLHSAMHPRPSHVNQRQAAEMVGVSEPTIRKMIRAGKLRLNGFGMIPIIEIDRTMAANA